MEPAKRSVFGDLSLNILLKVSSPPLHCGANLLPDSYVIYHRKISVSWESRRASYVPKKTIKYSWLSADRGYFKVEVKSPQCRVSPCGTAAPLGTKCSDLLSRLSAGEVGCTDCLRASDGEVGDEDSGILVGTVVIDALGG